MAPNESMALIRPIRKCLYRPIRERANVFSAIEYFHKSFESVNSLFEYLTFTGETIYATWAENNHEVICLNNAIDS